MLFAFSTLVPFPTHVPNSHYPFSPVSDKLLAQHCFRCQTHSSLSCPPIKALSCYFPCFSFLYLSTSSFVFFSYLQGVITAFLIAIIYPRVIYPWQKAALLLQVSPHCVPLWSHRLLERWRGLPQEAGVVSPDTWIQYNGAKPYKKAQALF